MYLTVIVRFVETWIFGNEFVRQINLGIRGDRINWGREEENRGMVGLGDGVGVRVEVLR